MEELSEGLRSLASTSAWRRYLDAQHRFHEYSFSNALLIAAQRPDATLVSGFRTWRQFGRSVRRGERAIWILAPVVVHHADDRGEHDDGRRVVAFRPVAVFDVAQTDGEALPLPCALLDGSDDGGAYERLHTAVSTLGYEVEESTLSDGTNGDCTFSSRRIRIEVRNSPVQRVKTLAHELAHALLHEHEEDRRLAELEAESVAYIACRIFGIDSARYSFGYVASWAGGDVAAIASIRTSCARIERAVRWMTSNIAPPAPPASADVSPRPSEHSRSRAGDRLMADRRWGASLCDGAGTDLI